MGALGSREIGAALVIAFVAGPSATLAGALTECGLHRKSCQALVGKRLWIVVPKTNPNTVEVSSTRDDWSNTLKLRTGSFLVTGIVPDKTFGNNFVVKLPDGKTGYVGDMSWIFLSETDPVEDAKKAAAAQQAAREECERRGQPKIGMSPSELLASCWGNPKRIVKKTTAVGVEESYIYGIGHLVKFTDGKISEIVEAR